MMKLRMNIYVTKEQKKALEKLSAKTGAPIAELIRRAVDAYLTTRKVYVRLMASPRGVR